MSDSKSRFVQSFYNTRVPCIMRRRTCYIIYRKICIGELTEEINDAGEFDWVIKVYWDKWQISGHPPMPGIDVDLRLDEYVRRFEPYIVSQRVPPNGRGDIPYWCAKYGMDEYDKFEFMVRNHGQCGNNMLLMGRTPDDYIDDYWDRLERYILDYKKKDPSLDIMSMEDLVAKGYVTRK